MTANLLRAELRKIVTLRSSWAVLGAAAALTVLSVIGTAANSGGSLPALATAAGAKDLYGAPHQVSILFAAVLGALAVGTELRHRTIAQTLLTTPRRAAVVQAKVAATLVAGAALGLACQLVGTVTAAGWLSRHHDPLRWGQAAVAGTGAVAVTAVCGAIGLGIGVLVRNQVVAVVLCLVWFLVIEGLLIQLAPAVGRWLPGGAAAAAAGTSLGSKGSLLPPAAGALVAIAYAVAVVAAGTLTFRARDAA